MQASTGRHIWSRCRQTARNIPTALQPMNSKERPFFAVSAMWRPCKTVAETRMLIGTAAGWRPMCAIAQGGHGITSMQLPITPGWARVETDESHPFIRKLLPNSWHTLHLTLAGWCSAAGCLMLATFAYAPMHAWRCRQGSARGTWPQGRGRRGAHMRARHYPACGGGGCGGAV